MKAYDADTVKRRVRRRVNYWQKRLGIEPLYRVRNVYVNTAIGDEEQTAADTHVDWEYRQCRIRWSLPVLATHNEKALDKVIVHEFMHVLTAPMRAHVEDTYMEQIEFATECLARAYLRGVK